ncbi:unnamed protein product [Pedinophyceae sp. YPF-701]|nr:unnamed protein product [Pedinophyceae sp. YPF-701]CAG9463579.1 unnamed protein product [Pedinophyceae sp. YPF-701]
MCEINGKIDPVQESWDVQDHGCCEGPDGRQCQYIMDNRRSLPVPQGAFYALPDLSAFFGPGCTADGFGAVPDCDALCRYILQDSLLALVPGDAFGSNSTVRISYAASLGMIEKAMDRLEAALAKIQRPQ